MSVASLNARITAAVAHMDAQDWDAALVDLLAAKALLAVLPDAGKGDANHRFRTGELDGLITECRRQSALPSTAAARNVARTKVTYVRTDSEDDY